MGLQFNAFWRGVNFLLNTANNQIQLRCIIARNRQIEIKNTLNLHISQIHKLKLQHFCIPFRQLCDSVVCNAVCANLLGAQMLQAYGWDCHPSKLHSCFKSAVPRDYRVVLVNQNRIYKTELFNRTRN